MESHFTIGFAGHVDHGKTTLVRCLTGVDTDRKPEEKRRGMSIEAGVAPMDLPSGRRAAIIDVPGHTDFLKNTIRGLNSVDLGVLVVAADDGVMPQTREHLEILKFFKASSGLVVLSKTDLVDPDTVELAELEVRELLSGTFLDNRPLFKFTAKNPDLSTELAEGIDAALTELPAKKSEPPFRLWVDQVRNLSGHGTVVSGTISSGMIRCDDDVQLLPIGIRARVRALKSHGVVMTQAIAGQRIGINLHRVSIEAVVRGMALVTPGMLHPASILNADIQVLSTAAKGIANRQKVKVYLGTSITNAMIVLMEGDRIKPGETGLAQIRLLKPIAALPQDALVISPLNQNTVIAGGRVLETSHEKFRASKAGATLPLLRALQSADANTYAEWVFEDSEGRLITARELSVKTRLPYSQFESFISSRVQKKELIYIKNHGAIRTSHMAALKSRFLAILEEAFRNDPLKKTVLVSEVAERLERPVENTLLEIIADELCREGKLVRIHGGYSTPDSEKPIDEHRGALISLLLEYAQQSGLAPFSGDTFWKLHRPTFKKADIQQLLNYLFSQKKLVRLNDQRFLSLDALVEIKCRVAQAIERNGFVTVGDCKELFGYGRWGGTHVLDQLDKIGFTVRREDKHYLKPTRS
jgi:selenocysteine-specific elongation factor